MSDGAAVTVMFGGYAFSCFVAAAIAEEFFGVKDDGNGPGRTLCGLCWPLVIAFWLCVGVWSALWWLAHTPVRTVALYRRRRIAALAEVERLLSPLPERDRQ